ncbi:hypothetical protein SAMN05444722_0415 [Rhodovulum sp. ES.010]|uniref:hypothetical protein n=1 Tax=Rhodovulum sp. ES.010 TaxID=1882821 RepID=UPI000926D678|nr:hypothetical protein [Rhodovulum sp. ES.010]SIO09992.1 hypothetical protein SAMN05444722_0415 [Rhodovulum sp. ES.010]
MTPMDETEPLLAALGKALADIQNRVRSTLEAQAEAHKAEVERLETALLEMQARAADAEQARLERDAAQAEARLAADAVATIAAERDALQARLDRELETRDRTLARFRALAAELAAAGDAAGEGEAPSPETASAPDRGAESLPAAEGHDVDGDTPEAHPVVAVTLDPDTEEACETLVATGVTPDLASAVLHLARLGRSLVETAGRNQRLRAGAEPPVVT